MKLFEKGLKVLRSKGLKVLIRNKKNEESGVALIMTLGVLSMLIVLALAFVSNAQTSSKMANSNAHNTNAKMIAEGAVQRIFAIQSLPGMTFGRVSEKCGDFNYPGKDDRNDTSNYNDFLGNISTNLNPSVDADYDDIGEYEYNPKDGVRWINITANGKLVGRFAYVVPVDHDSIPGLAPDACVSHDGDKSGSGSTAVVINAKDESTYSSERFGVHVHEISLQSLVGLDGSQITATDVKNLSSDAAGGTLADGSTWNAVPPGFTLMYDASHLNISSPTVKDKFQEEYFEIEGGLDPEAFWIDNNGNGEKDEPGELYVRFNIARTDWDDDHDGDGDTDNDDKIKFMNEYILVDAPSWSSGHADPDGKGINWLNSYSGGTDDPGTFPDRATKVKQIAANLIDYSDSDDLPTSDIDPAKWSSVNKPTFTGNELHPMVSEVWFLFQLECIVDDWDNDSNIDWHYTVKIYMGAEVCNPYGVELPGDAYVQVCSRPGELNADLRLKTPYGASGDTDSVGFSQDNIGSPNSKIVIQGPFPPGSYKSADKVLMTINEDYEAADGIAPPQNWGAKPKYGLNTVRLLYNGGDYTTIDSTSDESVDTRDIGYIDDEYKYSSDLGGHRVARFHIDVNDPRHNLNEEDWTKHFPTSWNLSNWGPYGWNPNTNKESPNAKNIGETSATVGDKEAQTTGANGIVSTAYIRNGPMKSPWEIGAIHRAAPWETINLKKFDPLSMDVMDDYEDGDGNILEQLKMTSDTELYGKVNINTDSDDCIRALVMNVRVGSTYENPASGGTPIGKADADLIAAGFGDKSAQWLRRGKMANVTVFNDGSLSVTQDDDASKEELLTKVINLCKATAVDTAHALVGPTANLILIAQAINDAGGKTIYKDLDFDGNVGVADETTVGIDLNGNGSESNREVAEEIPTEYERYDLNADEILSEVKMYITIEKNAGVWSITSKKFIE